MIGGLTMTLTFDSASLNYQPQWQLALQEFQAVLPKESLLTTPAQLQPFECDALSAYRQLPRAVLLPRNESEVQECLKICHRHRLPLVSRGGGTSLSGGALPHPQGVVMSLSKMMRILEINPQARTAIVEPGVRNLAVSDAASPYNLYYAPDPSSQLACTLGGNVAENAGGVHCLKYGLTVHNVTALSGFLIDGTPVSFSQAGGENAGLDLLALMHGSEGQLMVITRITVRLLPKPTTAKVLLAGFPTIVSAGAAVSAIISEGIIPAGLELMDQATVDAVEPFVHAGYPANSAAVLLCEADGLGEEVDDEINRVKTIMQAHGAIDMRVSTNEEERKKMWSGRKNAFPALGRLTADYYCMDGTIPRRYLAQMLSDINQLEKKYGLRCVNVFHAGDGNLHPLICYDASIPGQLEQCEAMGNEILQRSIALGGTVTGEHGVGLEKINQMCAQFSPDEIDCFHRLRRVFDEQMLMNPGKAIPTLSRCAELGGMHVHHGQLPHPEIPRF